MDSKFTIMGKSHSKVNLGFSRIHISIVYVLVCRFMLVPNSCNFTSFMGNISIFFFNIIIQNNKKKFNENCHSQNSSSTHVMKEGCGKMTGFLFCLPKYVQCFINIGNTGRAELRLRAYCSWHSWQSCAHKWLKMLNEYAAGIVI